MSYRTLDEYIEEVKFCFGGVGAVWPDDCEDDNCDSDNLDQIEFVTEEIEEETVITVNAQNFPDRV